MFLSIGGPTEALLLQSNTFRFVLKPLLLLLFFLHSCLPASSCVLIGVECIRRSGSEAASDSVRVTMRALVYASVFMCRWAASPACLHDVIVT